MSDKNLFTAGEVRLFYKGVGINHWEGGARYKMGGGK